MLICWNPVALGEGGSCSNYAPIDCSPPCASSCTYYTFSSGSITKTISQIPYNLLQLIPSGDYCDLQGEAGILATPLMKKFPYTIGPHEVKKLPATITLTYKIPQQSSKSGGSCSGGTDPSDGGFGGGSGTGGKGEGPGSIGIDGLGVADTISESHSSSGDGGGGGGGGK